MTHIKRYTAFLLALALFAGLIYVVPREGKESYAEGAMVATPVSGTLLLINSGATGEYGDRKVAISANSMSETKPENIPMYTIIQANGYGANYVKLRDICYYLDMDVVWNAENPNAMYIYTQRHYMDAWEIPGAAKETKIATPSSMDIYVNDVKVQPDSNPVLIDNNNYFKIRDLAKLLDVACIYGAANLTDKDKQNDYNGVLLDARCGYLGEVYNIDENNQAQGSKGLKNYLDTHYADSMRYTQTNPKTWESSVWYGGDSGTLSDTPVTYSARDAWAREDYWNSEENREYREKYEAYYVAKNNAEVPEYVITNFNALVQLLLDKDTIAENTDGQDGSNPYYVYPKTSGRPEANWRVASVAGWTNLPQTASLRSASDGERRKINTVYLSSYMGHESSDSSVLWQKNIIQADAADILATAKTFATDREKVTYLAHQVCNQLTYYGLNEYKSLDGTSELVTQYNLWEVWKDRSKTYSATCSTYSTVFSALAIAADFYVQSYTCSDENGNITHARNAVYLEDENTWVDVDCTWADGPQSYMTGNGYDEKWICYKSNVDWDNDVIQPSIAALAFAGRLKTTYSGVEKIASTKQKESAKTVLFDAHSGTYWNNATTFTKTYEDGIFYWPACTPNLEGHECWGYVYSTDQGKTWTRLCSGSQIPEDNLTVQVLWRNSSTGKYDVPNG